MKDPFDNRKRAFFMSNLKEAKPKEPPFVLVHDIKLSQYKNQPTDISSLPCTFKPRAFEAWGFFPREVGNMMNNVVLEVTLLGLL